MELVWNASGSIQAYDPEAINETKRIYGSREDLKLVQDRDSALEGADALVICTEWKNFRTVDFDWLKTQLNYPIVVDGRNLYDPETIRKAGLLYYAFGRADSVNKET